MTIVIVVTWNIMFLVTRWRACINAMHHGIDCQQKHNLYFKLESQKNYYFSKEYIVQQ